MTVLEDTMNRHCQLALRVTRPTHTAPLSSSTPNSGANTQVIELNSGDEDDDFDSDMFGGIHGLLDEEDGSLEDSEEDSVDLYRREQQWDQLRRQHAAVAMARARPAAAPVVQRAPVPYTPGEVIDLLSDDDEPPRPAVTAAATATGATVPNGQLHRAATTPAATNSGASPAGTVPQRANTATASTAAATTNTHKRALEDSASAGGAGVGTGSGFKRRKVMCGNVEIKLEFEPKQFGEANIGDEVVEVAGQEDATTGPPSASTSANGLAGDDVQVMKPTTPTTPAAAASAADDDLGDEDFVVVGTTMQVASDMPHQRYSCTTYPFRVEPPLGPYNRPTESPAMLAERVRINLKHCANCYCYVCDCKVTDCLEWTEHCVATHKVPKWKQEKDARNAKLLKLMTSSKRTAFFARYKDALVANHATGHLTTGSFLEPDENETLFLEADLATRMQYQALNPGAYPGPITKGKPGVAKNLTRTADLLTLIRLKLFTSRQPADRDRFLEASELLLRTLVSVRHSGDYPSQVAAVVVAWLFHPLCTADVRNVIRTELANAAPRNMVLASPVYTGLRQLLELPDPLWRNLREPSRTSTTPLPPSVVGQSELTQAYLIAELMQAGNYGAIKQLAQRRPALAHTLMVLYIRDGSAASCAEAVELACQANLQQKPFVALRQAIHEIATDKLLRFLGAGIAYNLRLSSMKGTAQAGWSLSGDCTDMLFGLLLSRASDQGAISLDPALLDVHAVGAAVATFVAASGSTYALDSVPTWIEAADVRAPRQLIALLVYLFVAYSNWRVAQTPPAGPLNIASLSTMLLTQTVLVGLRAPVLILLANSYRRHFVLPAPLDQTWMGGVSVGTVLACTIAQRALPMLSAQTPLKLLDGQVRNTWINLPELRKSKPEEICTAHGPARQAAVTQPAVSTGGTQVLDLRFCHVARPADRALNVLNPATRAITAESPRIVAHYCDLHYTYDTFLMALVAPKTVLETNVAQACWGHSLSLAEVVQLLRHLDGALLSTEGGDEQEEPNTEKYVGFLVTNRDILLTTWKTVVRHLYSYMHALFFIDNAPLAHLMAQLNIFLKPWLSSVDVVSATALAEHASCRGFTSDQLVELQALDLSMRMLYHFSNLLAKYKDNSPAVALPLQDLRTFKAAVMRLEAVGHNNSLAAQLCYMCLLEYPAVSTRAVWHSFWRRFLQSLISKRNVSTNPTDEALWETQATLLFLEDWGPLKEVTAKAAGLPKQVTSFIMGLALLQKSDFSTMNYGAVSGNQVLKTYLEPIAWTKFTVPLATNQLQPLPLISEKCVEFPESGLAHLVLQFGPELLQHGALDFQPYFAYALRRRTDASHAQMLPANAEAALKLVMQAYEDCVRLVSSPGRNPNLNYAKVLCGCVGLGRFDLVQKLVAAGFPSILHPVLPGNPLYASTRARALSGALLMAHNAREFELLLVAMDPFLAEVYTDQASVSRMAPVIKKFCSGAEGAFTNHAADTAASTGESSWMKQLKFYHHYNSDTFFDYWTSVAPVEKANAIVRLLAWTKRLEGTPRFRTETHISILSQIMDRAAFATFLSSAELNSQAYDKYQVMQALVKIVQVDPSSAVVLAPVLVRILFALTSFTPSMRSTLLSVCKPSALPPLPPSQPGADGNETDEAYSDARTLLLYLAEPDAHAEALGAVYGERYTQQQKQGLCHILLDRDRPEPFLKLLLKARDYPQLFWALRDVYYGPATQPQYTAVPVGPVALALEKMKNSLTLANVYNPALVGVGGGNASLSMFQKELFDDSSFVVCLAKFLLFLQSQHIDDKMVAFPAPLSGAVDALLNHVYELTHGDVVVNSYMRLHLKFTMAQATTFHNDCLHANFHSIPYTPTERNNASTPATLFVDVVRAIAQAPKYYTLMLAMVYQMYQMQIGSLVLDSPQHREIVTLLLSSPCTYHRDGRQSFETASGGVLWIPRADSSGALAGCAAELVKQINAFGTGFSGLLLGPVIQRLLGTDPDGAELNANALRQWALCFTDELRRVVYAMMPVASFGFLTDLFELQKQFQLPALMAHVDQALRSSYAAQYRKIVFKLAALAISSRSTNMRLILQALTHEFHQPNNDFATLFKPAELERLSELIGASEDCKHDVRVALIAQGKVNPLPAKCLIRMPRVLTCLGRDFANLNTYEHFAALSHVTYYAPLWTEIASLMPGTVHSDIVFSQATDCFRAIVADCRSNTVNARTRAVFEEAMQTFAQLFKHYPERGNELRVLKAEAKSALKSKPAVVKAMSVLG